MSNLAVSPYLWWTEGLALLVKLALWVTLFSELHYYHPLVISLFLCLSSITHLLSNRRKPSFLHYFHHPVFLQPPQCNIYSCSLAIQCTVTMSPVFVQARAENKTTLYPSSCKSHAALTSSETPDSQKDREVNHSASQGTRLSTSHPAKQLVCESEN